MVRHAFNRSSVTEVLKDSLSMQCTDQSLSLDSAIIRASNYEINCRPAPPAGSSWLFTSYEPWPSLQSPRDSFRPARGIPNVVTHAFTPHSRSAQSVIGDTGASIELLQEFF